MESLSSTHARSIQSELALLSFSTNSVVILGYSCAASVGSKAAILKTDRFQYSSSSYNQRPMLSAQTDRFAINLCGHHDNNFYPILCSVSPWSSYLFRHKQLYNGSG
jgi:hypothetical protein